MSDWKEVPLKICDRIGDFAIYAGSRFLIVTPLVIADAIEWSATGVAKLARRFHNSYSKLVVLYDSLPYGAIQSRALEISAKVTSAEIRPIPLLQILNDPTEEKELIILGTKGSGKSTTAQWLAYTLGGKIKVYEPEGTPYDWRGLEVLGKGENWAEINQGMQTDLEHLSSQLLMRRERGDEALTGTERVIIGEEYPEIASKVETSEEWLERHARRGRKARVRLILISQFDQAAAWNMEGKLQLLACFYRLRLTKMAKQYAHKLKRQDLVEWLDQSRTHALLDEIPVTLPSYEEMKRTIQQALTSSNGHTPQLQPVAVVPVTQLQGSYPEQSEISAETVGGNGFQTSEAIFLESPELLLGQILAAIESGETDSWIAKNILKAPSGNAWYAAKERVAGIRKMLGDNG